ncbi:VPS50 [Symbiodinium sp. CCMP2592]|nr:VPS50 [Symbiodinium sp. CCMP2592]
MQGSSASSSSSRPGKEVPKLPERFLGFEDVVAKELGDLDYPWNLKAMEERIQEYSTISEAINAQLSARVMQNYNEFVTGMQMVQSVETELSLIGVLVKNGRRKLQMHDQGITRGSMQVTRQHRRQQRMKELLAMLEELEGVVAINQRLRHRVDAGQYAEAIAQHGLLRDALDPTQYGRFPCLVGLQKSMSDHLALVEQKLSDSLRVAAVSADFEAERYEEILRAYSLLTADRAISVGKELLRHVSECIVAVSRQCMLAFSSVPPHESPADWHRKAQLRDLCRSMDPSHVVACTAQLYEHLCNFLYRHQFLYAWHSIRSEAAEAENAPGEGPFRELLRNVLTELANSKRNVWQSLQQQVSLVLMTLDFQYPALTEESFMHILHLTQLLVDEGDAFQADYQGANKSAMSSENRRQWSAPIRNTLKTKAHDYFQSLHFNAWAKLKASHIEQDAWQRLPVARNYKLLRAERLKPVLPRSAAAEARNASEPWDPRDVSSDLGRRNSFILEPS